jgi:hypothetical protein
LHSRSVQSIRESALGPPHPAALLGSVDFVRAVTFCTCNRGAGSAGGDGGLALLST